MDAMPAAIPIKYNCLENLTAEEIIEIFSNAVVFQDKFSSVAPVRPTAGQIFLFDLGADKSQWETRKKQLRCDEYRWVTKGVYTLKSNNFDFNIKKRSNWIDIESSEQDKGDPRFRRWEYWGFGSNFCIHYTGDQSIFKPFRHRSSKHCWTPYIRSAPKVGNHGVHSPLKVDGCTAVQNGTKSEGT
ncbi:uncharacterized protein [Dysidea avara]|uniref:uncharacterized protein n=1 Tax=Dysidea avara TaxID=196820 RepID=UPI003318523D